MVTLNRMLGESVARRTLAELRDSKFDVAIWAAGFERRARWLVTSEFRPRDVGIWYRAEFTGYRDALDAPKNLALGLGNLVGGEPQKADWDGWWSKQWRELLGAENNKLGKPLDVMVDISSMSRAVYATLILEALGFAKKFVRSVTVAYVPGRHGSDTENQRRLVGLRSLVGLEGSLEPSTGTPAVVLGLGFEGALTNTLLDVFEVDTLSCFDAGPPEGSASSKRTLRVNQYACRRAGRILSSELGNISGTVRIIERLCDWYSARRPVLLIPLGPKPHILASILVAAYRPEIGFRWPRIHGLDIPCRLAGMVVPMYASGHFRQHDSQSCRCWTSIWRFDPHSS